MTEPTLGVIARIGIAFDTWHALMERGTGLLPVGELMIDEIGLLIVVLITLGGIWLRLYVPRHRMSVEEQIKNNKLTETEARRQIKSLETWATVVTFLGLLLLVVVLWDMSN